MAGWDDAYFAETYPGCFTMQDLSNFGFALIAVTFVGFNRLSALPLVYTGISAVEHWLEWFTDNVGTTVEADGVEMNKPALIVMYFIMYFSDAYIVFYSYFILERLLPTVGAIGKNKLISRRTYLVVFWILESLNILMRAGAFGAQCAWMWQPRKIGDNVFKRPIDKAIYNLVLVQFLLIALIEILNAYLLIRIFQLAQKTALQFCDGRRVGLFKQMLLSTELRVSSLAIIGVGRAVLMIPKTKSRVCKELDKVLVCASIAYPALLILDLVMMKATNMEMELKFLKDAEGRRGSGIGGIHLRTDVGKMMPRVQLTSDGEIAFTNRTVEDSEAKLSDNSDGRAGMSI